jgi:uncharacterized membrane protein
MDSLIPAAGAAVIVSTLLQLLKNSAWFPLIDRETGKLNAVLSLIAAGFVTLGLSYNYSYDAASGAFTLGFSGTVGGVVNGLAHWAGQWTLQHAAYKGLIVPAEVLGEMRAILKDALGQVPQRKAEVPPTH